MEKSNRGASMVEYALLIALLSVIAIASVRYTGQSVADIFCRVMERRYDPATGECVASPPPEGP